ncbi:hypothetical protein LZ31DRAFT_250622 [Colletotrichum somersetense]|nr:hypothetical protein LZ31DRAFT_250622 [Colletotrichum somersetense]
MPRLGPPSTVHRRRRTDVFTVPRFHVRERVFIASPSLAMFLIQGPPLTSKRTTRIHAIRKGTQPYRTQTNFSLSDMVTRTRNSLTSTQDRQNERHDSSVLVHGAWSANPGLISDRRRPTRFSPPPKLARRILCSARIGLSAYISSTFLAFVSSARPHPSPLFADWFSETLRRSRCA